jgi:hypothetical protein
MILMGKSYSKQFYWKRDEEEEEDQGEPKLEEGGSFWE